MASTGGTTKYKPVDLIPLEQMLAPRDNRMSEEALRAYVSEVGGKPDPAANVQSLLSALDEMSRVVPDMISEEEARFAAFRKAHPNLSALDAARLYQAQGNIENIKGKAGSVGSLYATATGGQPFDVGQTASDVLNLTADPLLDLAMNRYVGPMSQALIPEGKTALNILEDMSPKQSISSAKTSLKQVPALLKSKVFEAPPNGRNLDLGGGAYDLGTDYLAKERGIQSYVLDPYNRTPAHNQAVSDMFKQNPADTVTVANVLNVIKEPEARLGVIQQAYDHVKPGGKVYFDIYEGNRSGAGGETSKGFQNNAPAKVYVEEVQRVFPDVQRRGTVLIATKPMNAATESAPVIIKLGAKADRARGTEDFMDALWEQSDEHPFDRRSRILGDATVEVSPFEDAIHLSDIRSLAPNTGAGTEALKRLTQMADEYGVPIEGTAKAYHGDDRYIGSSKRLAQWYKKHGFEILGGSEDDGFDIRYIPGSREE